MMLIRIGLRTDVGQGITVITFPCKEHNCHETGVIIKSPGKPEQHKQLMAVNLGILAPFCHWYTVRRVKRMTRQIMTHLAAKNELPPGFSL